MAEDLSTEFAKFRDDIIPDPVPGLVAERDALQARIDAAVTKLDAADRLIVDWQPSLEEWSKAVSLIINARGELKPFPG